MIRRIILRQLDAAEKSIGESMEYLRFAARNSLGGFFRFGLFTSLAGYRKKLPADAFHIARLVATRDEDCGTCVQTVVNLSRKDNVSPDTLKAVLEDKPENLSAELADVYQFAKAIVENDEQSAAPLRERLREKYGDEGFTELCLAIASCRVFPVTKRALGYGVSCSLVKIDV
jgi:alkylhydroperoxidase family enzyme